ncbi:hypothetical protein P691DRAFT_412580 [Macrolepiota fuliginosa MF-IS2]|uniref:Uncharacterized protein n=1 Tax=Macrolepiota fuliginosa MF-IS2 TaxID=1400762 RepID=A0A9P5X4Z5_9AGAR|nr:hypothetical protein P691DRAFT_412580 [Macrolepiota fuliginosa MF-IS2]
MSPLPTCGLLEELCGHEWRQKVILVNSHWDERVKDNGKQREAGLETGYWRFMLSEGSTMMIINPDQITRGQPL